MSALVEELHGDCVTVHCLSKGGRRRAGRRWEQGDTQAILTPAERRALEADPRFTVFEADPPAADEPDEDDIIAGASAPAPVGGAPPSRAPEALDAVAQAIRGLGPDDYTREGKPDARALKAALARDVSAAERDAAWAALEAAGFRAPEKETTQ